MVLANTDAAGYLVPRMGDISARPRFPTMPAKHAEITAEDLSSEIERNTIIRQPGPRNVVSAKPGPVTLLFALYRSTLLSTGHRPAPA